MRIVVLDIETANYETTSICQIGLVVLNDFEIVDTKEYLIKPYPNYYADEFTQLHGLSPADTDNAPTFDKVWSEIEYLFDKNTICIAHNASFDISHIKSAMLHYNIDYVDFPVVCTLQLSKSINLQVENYKLSTLCQYFNIQNIHSHTALSDAYADAELLKALYDVSKCNVIEFFALGYIQKASQITTAKKNPKRSRHFESTKSRDIIIDDQEIVENPEIFQKYFVITGSLNNMSRKEAYKYIKLNGGFVEDNVTRKTNFLVTNHDTPTGKMKKALEYREQGQDIKIINENIFYDLLHIETFE